MAPTIYTTEPPPTPYLSRYGVETASEDAHARAPRILLGRRFWVDDDVIGEGIRVRRGDRRDMIFIAVDNVYDFMRGFFEGFGHGSSNFDDVCTPR